MRRRACSRSRQGRATHGGCPLRCGVPCIGSTPARGLRPRPAIRQYGRTANPRSGSTGERRQQYHGWRGPGHDRTAWPARSSLQCSGSCACLPPARGTQPCAAVRHDSQVLLLGLYGIEARPYSRCCAVRVLRAREVWRACDNLRLCGWSGVRRLGWPARCGQARQRQYGNTAERQCVTRARQPHAQPAAVQRVVRLLAPGLRDTALRSGAALLAGPAPRVVRHRGSTQLETPPGSWIQAAVCKRASRRGGPSTTAAGTHTPATARGSAVLVLLGGLAARCCCESRMSR